MCAFLATSGCSTEYSKWPKSHEERIDFFQKHRAVFDSYVSKFEKDEVDESTNGYKLPIVFVENGIKEAKKTSNCIEITFWFMPTDSVPLIIYCPTGIEGVPKKYRQGGDLPGSWRYWKFEKLDEKWFYCAWDT
jgi:hypothetical protein